MRLAHAFALTALIAALAAAPASAECYAEYKAKRDDPYGLHRGVMEISACDRGAAEGEVADRLAAAGWTLLSVVAVFGPEEVESRRGDAGDYFLRY